MTAPKRLALELGLVPVTAWHMNLRSVLSAAEWDHVRRLCYAENSYHCSACGAAGRLECHEAWTWNFSSGVQRLDRLLALDGRCHAVAHSLRSMRLGGLDLAEPIIQHLMRVNGTNRGDTLAYVEREILLVRARSRRSWRLDISEVRLYGIEPDRTRVTLAPSPSGQNWWQRLLGAVPSQT